MIAIKMGGTRPIPARSAVSQCSNSTCTLFYAPCTALDYTAPHRCKPMRALDSRALGYLKCACRAPVGAALRPLLVPFGRRGQGRLGRRETRDGHAERRA